MCCDLLFAVKIYISRVVCFVALLVSPAELSNRLFPCAGFSVSKNSSQIRLLSGKQVIGETLARKNIFFLIEEKRNT